MNRIDNAELEPYGGAKTTATTGVVAKQTLGKYDVHIHKAGCRDLAKSFYYTASDLGDYADVEHALAELLDTGNPNDPGYHPDEVKVFPCVT